MADEGGEKVQYPLDSKLYTILNQIGVGTSSNTIIHRAFCIPMKVLVAIKSIDLAQSGANLDLKAESDSLLPLSHPNILDVLCSFTTTDRRLWIVMPFMSYGSFQSILPCVPDSLTEQCVAIVLKETLKALAYLHCRGHLHRDFKAGKILLHSDGSVKLSCFGKLSKSGQDPSTAASSRTQQFGYWTAPEVVHDPNNGYTFKSDIWSFGITALELARGGPPLRQLPASKSLIIKVVKRFGWLDLEDQKYKEPKQFSQAFQNMVSICLDKDPSRRPTADELLMHSFFRDCEGFDFFVKYVLHGLPAGAGETSQNVKPKRLSVCVWNLNLQTFQLEFKEEYLAMEIRSTDQSNSNSDLENAGTRKRDLENASTEIMNSESDDDELASRWML